MSNDSTTPGYLRPQSEPPTREAIEDALQSTVVGITGLAPALVRPRVQSEPPKQPHYASTWCSIGLLSWRRDGFPVAVHAGAAGGMDTVISWKTWAVMASFYGPGAEDMADRLMDGLFLDQNRDDLRAAGLTLASVGEPQDAHELVNQRWVRRVDLPLRIGTETKRVYGVRNILCGPVTIESGNGLIVQTTPMMEDI